MAISHLKRALEINPASAQAHSDLGIALAKSGQSTEAATEFKTALRIDPTAQQPRQNLDTAAQTAYDRGVELMKSKNSAEAIRQFQAAIAIKPDYVDAQYNLGAALAQAGKEQDALAHFEAAERLRPDPQVEQIIRQLSGKNPAQ